MYRQAGGRVTRQEVETGAMNDDEVVIVRGLAEDERVLLSPPRDKDKIELVRLPGSTAGVKPTGDTAAPRVPLSTGVDSSTKKPPTPRPAPPKPLAKPLPKAVSPAKGS